MNKKTKEQKQFEKIISKSKFTEKDLEELTKKVDEDFRKHAKKLMREAKWLTKKEKSK